MVVDEGNHKATSIEVQDRLNEILRLRILGLPAKEIQKQIGVNDRLFRWYMERLRDGIVEEAMAKRPEYFLEDITIATERLERDSRRLQETLANEKAPAIAKVSAARADAEIQLYILRIKYEGAAYINSLKSVYSIPKPLDPIGMKTEID